MIFIFTALYPEAKPFIDEYRLKKMDDSKCQIFRDENIVLAITGAGQINATIICTYTLEKYGACNNDFIINVGVCAGAGRVGDCYLINKITEVETGRAFYPDVLYKHLFLESEIYSGMVMLNETKYPAYDMESAGIYQAASRFVYTDRIAFIKIVSDNFDTAGITKESIEGIVSKQLGEITAFIKQCICIYETDDVFALEQKVIKKTDELSKKLHCTATMKYELMQLLRYAYTSRVDVDGLIEDVCTMQLGTKKEGIKAIEFIKGQLL